jgi:hypothetical protein
VSKPATDHRLGWMLTGLVAGLAMASLWPIEPARAVGTDSDDKFAICTVDTAPGQPEACFVLDKVSGRLVGGLLNQQAGAFSNFYFREIAADFALAGASKPNFVLIPGFGNLSTTRGGPVAQGLVYIGELTSGKVMVYRFPVRNVRAAVPVPLDPPFAFFSFRDAVTN